MQTSLKYKQRYCTRNRLIKDYLADLRPYTVAKKETNFIAIKVLAKLRFHGNEVINFMYAKYHKMFALGSDITCALSH